MNIKQEPQKPIHEQATSKPESSISNFLSNSALWIGAGEAALTYGFGLDKLAGIYAIFTVYSAYNKTLIIQDEATKDESKESRGFLKKISRSPSLSVYFQASVHGLSSLTSFFSGNILNAINFSAYSIATFALAKHLDRLSSYSYDSPKAFKKFETFLKDNIENVLTKPLFECIKNPAVLWILGDFLLAGRTFETLNLTNALNSSTNLAATIFTVLGFASGAFGIKNSVAKIRGNSTINDADIIKNSAFQCGLFSISNFLIGNNTLGIPFMLFAVGCYFLAKETSVNSND